MRLIDADRLKAAIHTDFSEHFTLYHDTDQTALFDMVMDDIDEMPTAFDKEKVIERLRGERDNQLKNWEGNLFWNDNRREDGIINGLSIAIEAVEKGGIE